MSITKRYFGDTDNGIKIDIFTLNNANGVTAEITNFGGVIVSLKVPDKEGKSEDIVLGYDSLEGYLKNNPHFGAIIGRHANRIENACFEINGRLYNVTKNEGKNQLHGGLKGFDKVIWKPEIVTKDGGESLVLTYKSVDKEEGYPGNLDVKVTYSLSEDNALKINYCAVSDKDTVVNLTNHSYFNLSGHNSGSILNHKVMINADKFTPADEYSLPTGEIVQAAGTPMDFTKLKTVGQDINKDYDQLIFGQGYDHNWVLNTNGDIKDIAAEVLDENSGRIMEVYTTMPGIQFYTANYLDDPKTGVGKDGTVYKKGGALCLETQYFPNSLKHKNFPSPILKAGEKYNHTTIYKFSILK